MQGTTVEQRKQLAGQAGQWVWEAMAFGAMLGPRWSIFRNQYDERFLEFLSYNHALLFTEMVTWCRDNAALVPVAVDVPSNLKRPPTYAINDEITFDPGRWLTCGCPLFASIIRDSIKRADDSVADRNMTDAADSTGSGTGSDHDGYMPSTWYLDKFGIPATKLRAAKNDGRVRAINIRTKRSPKYLYSVSDARAAWPDDGIYLPESRADRLKRPTKTD